MRKVVCNKCKKVWYTANTFDTEESITCDECSGKLEEVDFDLIKYEYLKGRLLNKST